MSELRQAVKQYLDAISAVSRVGTPELSHYTALDNLFDAVGDELIPKVRAVVHYSETASGQPDLGFFSGESTDPDRGVVEVKGADADLHALIDSEQVDEYWQARKLVLVTNLREFALVGPDSGGAKATLEQALGMSFESEDGGRFFRSTLVQTLFYGVFAAWVLWARAGKPGRFGWKDTVYELRAPVLRMLFHQINAPGRLERLGLDEVLDWTRRRWSASTARPSSCASRRARRCSTSTSPSSKRSIPTCASLGVWYTPREIVRYMVALVDRALRDDLGIARGLADERVYVLDPCCGVGAFLVETLRRIAETEQAEGDATWAESVRQAAASRVFGFDIMPAPLVVSHLETGLPVMRFGVAPSRAQVC